MSTNTPGSTPKEEKKKKPFTLTFRIRINTPSGSSSRECCISAQDCFKGPRLAAVAEHQAPQVGTIEQSKVEKAISIRGSATLWATTEAPAEPEQKEYISTPKITIALPADEQTIHKETSQTFKHAFETPTHFYRFS